MFSHGIFSSPGLSQISFMAPFSIDWDAYGTVAAILAWPI
jgi:hypothetical protein